MRPVIGITTYAQDASWGVWHLPAALIPLDYVDAVERAGGRPILIPPSEEGVDETLDALDGIVFSGGADVDPKLYGAEAHPATDSPQARRDAGEMALLQAALERDLPTLAICRGFQLLNVARGGDLVQHLPEQVGSDVHKDVPGEFAVHPGRGRAGIAPRGDRRRALGGDLAPPSGARAAWGRGSSRPRGRTTERSRPSRIPSLRFAVGVQWHPEAAEDQALFDALVGEARAYRGDSREVGSTPVDSGGSVYFAFAAIYVVLCAVFIIDVAPPAGVGALRGGKGSLDRWRCCSSRSSRGSSTASGGSSGAVSEPVAVPLTVLNPATEEPIAELEQAGVDETDAAVARAKEALPAWRAVAPADRARLLRRLATLVEENAEELARIESRNVGKPIAGARGEVGMVAQVFHFYAGAVDKHYGDTIPVAGGVAATFREPLGVVGLIVPWNFPLNISSWKLGPALACGNTVVLKPAELTPLSALRLAELALEAGIPEGVAERARRQGLGRRAAADRASRRREDRLHGLDRGRSPRHAGRRRRRSSASLSSSAASRRTSSSPTPTWSGPRPRRRTRSSTTPARTAARARGSWSRRRSTTAFSTSWSRRLGASRSGIPATRPPRWGR